ncbi:MAG: LysM peptidoglycan-binding domain-containing protein [Nocardiaceae bacterium]|nr:LysM peptidoglycan-binding domain-containing protein [Nocardiaceae bacterium]
MAAAVVVTACAVLGLGALANLTGASGAVPTETAAVRVQTGETLSDVASRVAPGAPVGSVVDRIMELNEMSSAAVRAGQTLLAPVSLGR